MTCINPIAPFCETARASPKLSTRITARIQLSGMLNRWAASVTKTAKGRAAGGQAGRPSRKRQRSPRHKSRSEAAGGARRRSAGAGAAAKRAKLKFYGNWASRSQRRETWPERGSGSAARRAKTPSSNCAQTACSLLFGGSMGPKGSGAADDRGGGQWPEVPPVKRVGRPRVHGEDFAHGDDAAALPDGERPATTVALTRFADRDGVHADCEPVAADRLSGKRRDMFHERHATRQVTAVGEEARERLRRLDRDQISDSKSADGMDRVEPDRHAGAGVPDQPRRTIGEPGRDRR